MRPGDRVAFIGASGPEFAEVMYGAAKCRAIFAAVNNRLSAREVLAILADAGSRVVVTDPAAAALAVGFKGAILVTDGGYQSWRDAAPAEDPGEQAGPDETALLLYTSGTTGAPKGVELTGRNLGCALHELHTDIGLDTRSVCAAPIPFFHVAGLGMLLAANLNGGNLLLEQQADIAGVLRLLVDRKVTHAVLVPTVLQRLLGPARGQDRRLERAQLRRLRGLADPAAGAQGGHRGDRLQVPPVLRPDRVHRRLHPAQSG